MTKLPWLFVISALLHSSSRVLSNDQDQDGIVPVEDDLAPVDGEIQGSSHCARVNGCHTDITQFCTGPSGTGQCHACFYHSKKTHDRNIFRADFYESVKDTALMNRLKGCTGSNCPFPYANEMAKYMLLKDDRVARSAQGSTFQHFNIPDDAFFPVVTFDQSYATKFCDSECVLAMKEACFGSTLITHVRNWCLDILEWVQDEIPNLQGPASFIAYLAAKATYGGRRYALNPKRGHSWPGKWPESNYYPSTDERAVVVAAAATSILLTGNWWSHLDMANVKDFGFAVQHSLFIAIYAGRLRISLQQVKEKVSFLPGTLAFCSAQTASNAAPNFSGVTGNVFATICTVFGPGAGDKKLRYRPEIHERNAEGCVERTAGMAFIMPGDWITTNHQYATIGSTINPGGLTFRTQSGNTPLELYSSGVGQLFAPAVAVDLQTDEETMCTGDKGKGNGANLNGDLARAGIRGVGGICNWVASW